MKLTHVAVEGCGRFGTPARIEGFRPGVNILSARNEAGKSTLFRAIRTCLFERHSSVGKDIQALATDGLSLPVSIRVGFEHGGKHYDISKSFLKGKAASLRCDGVEIARNAEADERVWDLLGIAPRSARALDEASYGLLWVQQGQSFDAPEPSEGAVSMLNAVIQQEVGTLVGGERARQVLSTVREELGRYLTDSGRVKTGGPLHAAIEANARLTEERMEVEARLSALNDKLDELARLRADYRQAADPATLNTLKSDLEESRRKLAEAEKAGEELRRLSAEERQAHELAEAQRERLEALKARSANIDALRQRLKEASAALAPLEQETADTASARKTAEERKMALDTEADEIDRRERELGRLADLAAMLTRRERLDQRLTQLEDFRDRAAANEAALKTARVDESALKALEALEIEETKLRARLEVGAAQIAIAAKPDADVRVNGASVSGTASRAVTEPVTIEVGADVTITVSPPQATRDAAAKSMAEHREKLTALLAGCGATDAADLRRLRAERIALEERARDLRAERAALAVKDGLGKEIETLQAAISEIDAEARRSLPEGTTLPPHEEIERQKQEIAECRTTLRAARTSAEAQLATHDAALRRLGERRAGLRAQSDEIHARLESELALLPDERRAEMLAACEAELASRRDTQRIKAALVADKQAAAPAEDEAQRLSARVERLASAIKGQQDRADQLRDRIARLEGEVQVAGGDGLGERAATLKLQQEMAIAEEARITARVDVLKLLQSTVKACHDRRRDQLNAPLRRHLKPFLHDVFPKAEIELGENFAIAGLSRSGPAAELFGRLSLGTQEQIAVLVRLAMGAMICERGADVPIILDDALVYSDDERIEQMFDAINRAGRNQQVIVLTCRARSFTSLGGTQLQIV